jgi:pyruvate/2-oxoglutarate/acetoin dehydrogenase E1 component
MPSSPSDAYRLLKQSLCASDPVLFIEDRWDYSATEKFRTAETFPPLSKESAKVVRIGTDITLWGTGHTTNLNLEAANFLHDLNISCEVIDQRVLSPFKPDATVQSVAKTGHLLSVENTWSVASMGSEILASVSREISSEKTFACASINLPFVSAPTSPKLEDQYYVSVPKIVAAVRDLLEARR